MKISSCYLSCPLSVPQQTLDKYIKKLRQCLPTEQVRYYKRGTSYDEGVYDMTIYGADAFVLVLPDNSFRLPLDKLTAGCKRELILAMSCNKRLYLAYEAAQGFNIYEAVIIYENGIPKRFEGIAGTSGNFEKSTRLPKQELIKDFNTVRVFSTKEPSRLFDKACSVDSALQLDNGDFSYIMLDDDITLDWDMLRLIHIFYNNYKVGTPLSFAQVNRWFQFGYGQNMLLIAGDGDYKEQRLEIGIKEKKGYAKYLGQVKTMAELRAARRGDSVNAPSNRATNKDHTTIHEVLQLKPDSFKRIMLRKR